MPAFIAPFGTVEGVPADTFGSNSQRFDTAVGQIGFLAIVAKQTHQTLGDHRIDR